MAAMCRSRTVRTAARASGFLCRRSGRADSIRPHASSAMLSQCNSAKVHPPHTSDLRGRNQDAGVRMPNDFLSFFLSWMSAPRQVGAIAPSGAALADLITREITESTGPILELGPRTGAFTHKLLKRGVRPQDLTLIENGSDFTHTPPNPFSRSPR